MAGTERQKIKILYIMKILWEETDEKHIRTAGWIVNRLEDYGIFCERKSVYRDLDELTEYGLDIIRTGKGAYLASRPFELPELRLLADMIRSSQFVSYKRSAELIAKLKQLVSRYDAQQLEQESYAVRVKSGNETIFYNIDAITQGIRSHCRITFFYGKWNAEKQMERKRNGMLYEVSPWMLEWEDGRYYLVAYDEKAGIVKYFRVDKMQQITQTQRPAKTMQIREREALQTERFRMFQGIRQTVTLRLKPEFAGVVIDRFGREVWLHKTGEEELTAVVELAVNGAFFGWIAGMGGGILPVQPVWVREACAQHYEKLLQQMKGDGMDEEVFNGS